jgi:hexokinase
MSGTVSGALSVLAGVRQALAAETPVLLALSRAFAQAMERGLAGAPSSLRMLPTFARPPRGDERGRVVVVDWGGTHGRVAIVGLDGLGGVCRLAEGACAFTAADKTGPAERVFDALAAAVGTLIGHEGGDRLPLGFVYSFPARLERIDRAIALPQTKGWRVTGLEGEDVVDLLGRALGRHGLGRVSVSAVANDTVSALALQTYRRRGEPAAIGLILGTGVNQAADLPGRGIFNLESGNFDGLAEVETPWDVALDREVEDPPPGAQRFEKMVSGRYLGEVLRRVVVHLGREAGLFRWEGTAAFGQPFGLDSAVLSWIAADRSADLGAIASLLAGLGAASTADERSLLKELSALVARRSARLVAASLVGTLWQIDPALERRHTIAVDGSLWTGYPGFEALVGEAFADLLGARAEQVHAVFVKDSTSAGAAVLAATAARDRG